ncbi:hypothetical protein [Bradyrhizobium sp. 141]|uniref:hypothetical protein n=1 Tax=Bradyrhizobium sp. 141 TaxID=2782617 RepID=UPI00320B24B3
MESGGCRSMSATAGILAPPCYMLQESTAHLEGLRVLAQMQGMSLELDGLHKADIVVARKEEDIYRALGLPFIEPELREGRGEIGHALEGKLPKLVADRDLHGILHCHTDASDETETLEMMAKATRERGFAAHSSADFRSSRSRSSTAKRIA